MTKLRILLVEDNPGDARLVQLQLRELETPVDMIQVDRLSLAVEKLAAERFDAVLLDLSLPDSTGMNTVSTVITQAPDVAVVVLTGLADEATGRLAIQTGAQDYLVKGRYDSDLLRRSLLYSIERKTTQRRLDLILRSLSEGVIGVDPRGMVTFMNHAAQVLSGWSPTALVGKNLFDILRPAHADDGACDRHAWSLTQTLGDGEARRDSEGLIVHADGTKLSIEAIVTPIEERGRVAGAVYAFHDITDRQQAFAVLRRQIAFQHQLLDNLPNPVFYADRTLTLIGCNAKFAQLHHRAKETLLGRALGELLPETVMTGWEGEALNGRIGHPPRMEPLNWIDGRGQGRSYMLETVVFADPEGGLGGMIGTLISADELQGA